MIGLLIYLAVWTIRLAAWMLFLAVRCAIAAYKLTEELVHAWRSGRDPRADRATSRAITAGVWAICILVLGLIGSISGGGGTGASSGVAAAPAATSTPQAAFTAEKPSTVDEDRRRVRIVSPKDGRTFDSVKIDRSGERRAVVRVRGTGEPGASVFVSGDGDGTSSDRDDATVTVGEDARWAATINVYGCGPGEDYAEITAGYDEPYADEDSVEVRVRCRSAAASHASPAQSSAARSNPAPSAPAGTCAEIPARNFPVPPGDPRDGDGDGIACES
jgi:hypothetical protein